MQQVTSLQNKLIIAMPQMKDPIFEQSVVFICHHDEEGAMGLILNKPISNMTFTELTAHFMEDDTPSFSSDFTEKPVRMGGPVEDSQGFVLHSSDYKAKEQSTKIGENIYLNASIDLVTDITKGEGPSRFISFLGYSGWSKGQLEREIMANGWLHCSVKPDFLWRTPIEDIWKLSLEMVGVSVSSLSYQAGHG